MRDKQRLNIMGAVTVDAVRPSRSAMGMTSKYASRQEEMFDAVDAVARHELAVAAAEHEA